MTGTSHGELVQIGQGAERMSLSLRTIRLYSEADVARLEVIKRRKPLGFTLEEMQELLTLLADLDSGTGDRVELVDRLRVFHAAATARVTALRDQLAVAEGFAETLAGALDARR